MTLFDPRVTPARPDLAAARLRGLVAADHYVEGHASHVCAGTADLRHAPAPDAPLDTQALFGEEVTLYEDHEGWGWVQLVRDGYVGYMSMAALAEGPIKRTHRVTVNRSIVYPGPDLKLPPHDALPLGASVCVRATKAGFAQIDDAAFVFSGHLMPSGENQKEFVAVAERLLHAPYLWGGKTSLGIDCSGLVQISLAAAGIDAPRDTDLQEQALRLPIAIGTDLAGLRRGDLKRRLGLCPRCGLRLASKGGSRYVESGTSKQARRERTAALVAYFTTRHATRFCYQFARCFCRCFCAGFCADFYA